MKASSPTITVFVLFLVLLLSGVHISKAVTCDVTQLSPCLGAITSSSTPSSLCCTRIQNQKPCLCRYLKNPFLSQYVNSPGAKKVASYCRVPYPNC
ncbi:hypothetical protein LIER_23838 [Lithospermum erythrorhizon]|uniref:Bifunctional inhibitor/plant lipid transfer protein/seed storage helical domain-containing protein n=1 Tax=Lithospermum erythrorhizon TaxID=34254 RepID=A0AAV3R2U9_LITER